MNGRIRSCHDHDRARPRWRSATAGGSSVNPRASGEHDPIGPEEAILLQMHAGAQAQHCAAKSAQQAVVYYTVAGAAATVAFIAVLLSNTHLFILALIVGEAAFAGFSVFGATYWFIEVGRMQRSGLIAYHIEKSLLSRHRSLDPRCFLEYATRHGGHEGASLEIRGPHWVLIVAATAATVFCQIYFPRTIETVSNGAVHILWWGWLIIGVVIASELGLFTYLGLSTRKRFGSDGMLGNLQNEASIKEFREQRGLPV